MGLQTETKRKQGSDERPGIIFLAFLVGSLAGMMLFHQSAYQQWDKRGEGKSMMFGEAGRHTALLNGVWGYRYQLLGLLIHEEVHWLDRVEKVGLPGGYVPWMIAFGVLGGGLMSVGVWVIAYRRAAVKRS